ncbi:MAG: BLUF domain-containing protein [Marinobacter sp.]|uniref:BLUF domain-containing protein n=1 Tax=Marinobacter sp. TaxID=50741 RepID=UPI00299EA751|nr:BLUF domain-containing protein [Marinobacter sp.]MDX1756155.1 BLUF domain-containing protein [Marinobacter sp.]
MGDSVYQLIYISTASVLLDEPTLLKMLQHFRQNNAVREVTGLMLYCDGNILQLLEGDEAEVESLFCVIASDPRHESVTRLYAGRCGQRDFPEWRMGFQRWAPAQLPLDPDGFSRIAENPDIANAQVDELSPEVQTILQAFRQASRI